jgi:hypothetical protein
MARLAFNRVSFEVTRRAAHTASSLSVFRRSGANGAQAGTSVGATKDLLLQARIRRLAPWDHQAGAEKADRVSKLLTVPRLPWVRVEVSAQQAHVWRALAFPAAGDSIFDGYLAQAILNLDIDDADYLSGRRRQALRTNIRHAESKGIRAVRLPSFEDWYPVREEMFTMRGVRYNLERTSAPGSSHDMGYFVAIDAGGQVVAEAAVAIFERSAVLFSAMNRKEHPAAAESRYLLHTFMRSELKAQGLRHVIAGSVLRTRPGVRYFQHLVGYDICNLAVTIRREGPKVQPDDRRTVTSDFSCSPRGPASLFWF